jgi:hypothetical protein
MRSSCARSWRSSRSSLLQPSIINHLIQVCPAAVMLMGISHDNNLFSLYLVLPVFPHNGFPNNGLKFGRLKLLKSHVPSFKNVHYSVTIHHCRVLS